MLLVSIWARRLQSRPAHHDLSNFTSVPYSHYPLRVEWGEMLLLSDRAGAPHRASLKAELLLMPGAGDNGVSSHLVASTRGHHTMKAPFVFSPEEMLLGLRLWLFVAQLASRGDEWGISLTSGRPLRKVPSAHVTQRS